MFSNQHNWIRLAWTGLALLVFQASAQAGPEVLTLRNESSTPVQVHVAAIFQGRVTYTGPILLKPHTATNIVMAGDKNITLYDARVPTRQLFKDTIRSSPYNQTHAIQHDQFPPKLKLMRIFNP